LKQALPTPLTQVNRSRGRIAFRNKTIVSKNKEPISERLLGQVPEAVCKNVESRSLYQQVRNIAAAVGVRFEVAGQLQECDATAKMDC